MMDKVAIYTRVSTNAQDERSQRADLENWLGAHQLSLVETLWYHDSISGVTMDRPKLLQLLDLAQRGAIKTIVIWRLDRLGRTASGLTKLFDNLREWGVNLVSLRDGIDLLTPAGRLMANVIASVAQYETEVRRERQQAGIEAAKLANGGKCPWGGNIGDRTHAKNHLTPEKIELIHELTAKGYGRQKVANAIGCSVKSVYLYTRRDASCKP